MATVGVEGLTDHAQEKQVKTELETFEKVCDAEAEKMRLQLDAETSDVIKYHEQRMARVIGHQLTVQARKHVKPSITLDPVVGKIEVLCYCAYFISIVLSSAVLTRSQAVARIADRTAKNCKGHVT